MNWIKCSDELPKIVGHYITFYPKTDLSEKYVGLSYFLGDAWLGSPLSPVPTHWMPYPEPPEENELD